MEVLVNNRQKKVKLNLSRLKKIAEEVMRYESLPENSELSIVLCDDDFIQKLNNEYLGRNSPTDVLAFPIEEDEFEPAIHLIGDVVISTETALRQANKLGHPVEFEIVFLLIHGILHLAGYDHTKSKSEMARMKLREEEICLALEKKKMLKGLQKKPETLIKRSMKKTKSNDN